MSSHDLTPPIDSRPIPFAPGYRICDDGTVWSCRDRSGRGGLTSEWHILKPGILSPSGYRQVHPSINGKKGSFYVHRLVLEIFVGPPPDGMEACHWDGDPSNNHVSNLRWDYKKGNCEDRKRHGTDTVGERHGHAKLKNVSIPEIFRLYRAGFRQKRIADVYGVSQTLISQILLRKIWSHVPIDAEETPPIEPG